MKRVLICGGRDYGVSNPRRTFEYPKRAAERRRFAEVLTGLFDRFGAFQIIHGGAKGADSLAQRFWEEGALRLPTPLVFPADWDNVAAPGAVVKTNRAGRQYNVLAGPMRNQKMVDEGRPDLCVAFPGGTGTADMVSRCRKANIEVMEIK